MCGGWRKGNRYWEGGIEEEREVGNMEGEGEGWREYGGGRGEEGWEGEGETEGG